MFFSRSRTMASLVRSRVSTQSLNALTRLTLNFGGVLGFIVFDRILLSTVVPLVGRIKDLLYFNTVFSGATHAKAAAHNHNYTEIR